MSKMNFKEQLKKYAELIVKVGVNVSKGQTIVLQISVTQQELAHLIVDQAYAAGASEVIVKWADSHVAKSFLEFAPLDRLVNVPGYTTSEVEDWVAKKASRISVMSDDPDAFAGISAEKIASRQKAMGQALRPLRKATQNNDVSWTVVAAADTAWAELVFPELKGDAAVSRLWEEIFKTTRIDQADPIKAWHQHDLKLRTKAEELNQEQFSALHYVAPGTDIVIGLPKNHLWEGAGSFDAQGFEFMANMPTEEVFTAPDSRRIDGYISSTKPLSYAGTTLSGMKFTFEAGKVVEATAEQGEDVLQHLLATDDGAKSLGEVALVPDPSPISQSGITFYNTLFDENASDHLALGSAYPFSIKNGTKMNDKELADAGLNLSQTHVDFMVGSADMSIDGIREDGSKVPVFRNGDWA
ncbi:aminopeptidase [Dellaglioa algida]|uniref:Aminopeptidase PepS n=1 Tax=Dellaglioa algida DSM 15638 TaxID=1423719 RepID=A0A0R1HGY5_9LACO|nr:aminopeptidase [Dellaglioa algida]KRK45535.1 aminopeptidase PepS [Dellaglioa algida DSM 15638]MDK1718390.1 aminopeptidase [Dellaglioa algida]MDK1728175.1 aminopeptidase [Dellaglioa algida]MDK1729518.1 aminopeptidase [Dellaglioa algida]MDK1732034.1 aminopeptidase [Dellaglioa algida]